MRIFKLLGFLWIALLSSCSESSDNPTSAFSNKPEALAAEDTKSGGIYKGVIVGSSGFFTVVLQNDSKEVRVTLDGESKSLATTSIPNWVSGELIKNAVFVSGDWSATFSVGIDGRNPSITFSIPGHPDAQVVIIKELSSAVARLYEGTYSGTNTGSWNFIIQGPVLSGVSRTADGSGSMEFSGIINGSTITLSTIAGSGTITVDNVNGTWQDTTGGGSGTWTGKRIL